MASDLSRHRSQIGDVGPGAIAAQGENISIHVENISRGLTAALPGPILANLPELPNGYRPRETDLQALKALLIDSEQDTGIVGRSRAAGLRGMGGIGKTVLAAALVLDREVQGFFSYGIVWLTFGRAANAMAQLAVLTRAVTGQLADYTTAAEARADLGRLLGDRRLLIVLDDIWQPGLVDGFRGLAPGCHLLITTRLQAVVERANARAHHVGLLDTDASRALLAEALGSADLPDQADKVLGECGGLPLALTAAAGIVRRWGWADTLSVFARARLDMLETPWLPDNEQRNLAVVLAASVQALPEQECVCFLECALWPEDAVVSAAALKLFWSAHAPDELDQRRIAEALIAASLLLRDSGGSVRLHDLYHDYLRHLTGAGLAAKQAEFANRCVRFTENGCELIDGSAWVLEHLPWHFLQAGCPEKVMALQFDYAWLTAKLAQHGVQSLIADTRLVEDAELDRLGRTLRLSAHVLARDHRQLAAQLLGRLHEASEGQIAKLLACATADLPNDVLVPRVGKHLVGPGVLVATLEGHDGWVQGAALLPDGRGALSWSSDRTLRLWDLASGEGRILQGHGGRVNGALLLSEGRALIWSDDHTLRLWDLASGEGRRPLQGHGGSVRGALLLPDGRALSWSDDHTLRLWDLASGEGRPLQGHDGRVNGALLLPEGRALSWSDDHTLRLWDLASGEGRRPLQGHGGSVRGALLLPDGRALSWSSDHTLRLWDLASGEGRPLRGHGAGVTGALLLPDGRALSWSDDQTLRLWDLVSNRGRRLRGHGGVTGALLLPDGRALSWSDDQTLRLWDLASGEGKPLRGHDGRVTGALPLPDGRALSWSSDETLRLWDLASGEGRPLQGHDGRVNGALPLPDGRALSWSDDQTLRLWDLASGEGRPLQDHDDWVRGMLLLPDGRALSWSDDRTLRLWDLANGEGRPLQGHGGGVRGALLLPDGRALSWASDETLQLWDLASGEGRPLLGHGGWVHGALWDLESGKGRRLQDHGGGVHGALLLPDGRALSWASDQTLRLWDLESGKGRPLRGHGGWVRGALLLPDGRALSWSDDQTLRLWDLESGEGRSLQSRGSRIHDALLLPDGRVLSWSFDWMLRLWNLESRKVWRLQDHRGQVNGALLLPDGRALSWSDDQTLRLWDLESRKVRCLQGHGGRVNGALLLPDGRALSWSSDRTLRLWDLANGEARPLQGHDGGVRGALLLPDGRALSWSSDRTLRLWDLQEQREQKRFVGDDFITTVAFSEPHQLLLAGDARGRVMFFDLPP
jgi:WD40 repeat protein